MDTAAGSSVGSGGGSGSGTVSGMEARIRAKIEVALRPAHLEVLNESHKHNVPAGSESHWNLIIVSEHFEGRRLVARHRAVYDALGEELRGGIHALALKTLSLAEWAASGGATENPSPPCLGGSKSDG